MPGGVGGGRREASPYPDPAVHCWDKELRICSRRSGRLNDNRQIFTRFSRPLLELHSRTTAGPSDESLGYFQWSANADRAEVTFDANWLSG